MEWALLDPLNPAMGLELTYTGGNTCKEAQFQDADKCDYKGSDGSTYCTRGMRIRMVGFLFFLLHEWVINHDN